MIIYKFVAIFVAEMFSNVTYNMKSGPKPATSARSFNAACPISPENDESNTIYIDYKLFHNNLSFNYITS